MSQDHRTAAPREASGRSCPGTEPSAPDSSLKKTDFGHRELKNYRGGAREMAWQLAESRSTVSLVGSTAISGNTSQGSEALLSPL